MTPNIELDAELAYAASLPLSDDEGVAVFSRVAFAFGFTAFDLIGRHIEQAPQDYQDAVRRRLYEIKAVRNTGKFVENVELDATILYSVWLNRSTNVSAHDRAHKLMELSKALGIETVEEGMERAKWYSIYAAPEYGQKVRNRARQLIKSGPVA